MLRPSSYHAHASGSRFAAAESGPGAVGSGAGQSSMARGGGGGVAEGGSAAFMRDGGSAWSRRRQPARGREKGRCERLAVGRGVWRWQMDLRGAGKGGEGEMEAD
jgi:hypothetical protein